MKHAWLTLNLILLSGFLGCANRVTDAIVDNEVQKIVAAENQKLPQDLGNGIELQNVSYDSENNRLTLNYTVVDPASFQKYWDKIKFETKKRTRNNGSLQRALANDLQIFHDFKSNADGQLLKSYETPQE